MQWNQEFRYLIFSFLQMSSTSIYPVREVKNMLYYASENLHQLLDDPFHNFMLRVWLVLFGFRFITRYFYQTVTAYRYVHNMLNIFVYHLREYVLLHVYFQQEGATMHRGLSVL